MIPSQGRHNLTYSIYKQHIIIIFRQIILSPHRRSIPAADKVIIHTEAESCLIQVEYRRIFPDDLFSTHNGRIPLLHIEIHPGQQGTGRQSIEFQFGRLGNRISLHQPDSFFQISDNQVVYLFNAVPGICLIFCRRTQIQRNTGICGTSFRIIRFGIQVDQIEMGIRSQSISLSLDILTGTFHIHLIQFHPGSLIDIFQYHIGIKDTLVEFLESDIPPGHSCLDIFIPHIGSHIHISIIVPLHRVVGSNQIHIVRKDIQVRNHLFCQIPVVQQLIVIVCRIGFQFILGHLFQVRLTTAGKNPSQYDQHI